MRERPILFSDEMVRAILDGRKTQTRRICKLRPWIEGQTTTGIREWKQPWATVWDTRIWHTWDRDGIGGWNSIAESVAAAKESAFLAAARQGFIHSPFGEPGDRLWVREAFAIEDPREYWWEDSRKESPADRPWKWLDVEMGKRPLIPHYRADGIDPHIVTEEQVDAGDERTRWRPSIHMPRWASRITLEVTAVRVERLNEISQEDAIGEGMTPHTRTMLGYPSDDSLEFFNFYQAADTFRLLWESLNGPGSWDLNPWVWVIEFRRAEAES